MLLRSFVLVLALAGTMGTERASAQAIACPGLAGDETGLSADALIDRFLSVLALRGHEPVAALAKEAAKEDDRAALIESLAALDQDCQRQAGGGLDALDQLRPPLRRQFLEILAAPADAGVVPASAPRAEEPAAKAVPVLLGEVDLSVKELWRSLWFRPATEVPSGDKRFAVIVASPEDEAEAWSAYADHQERWTEVHFELYRPYQGNDHHALVVGRRLTRDEAARLAAYVKDMGMADDSYLWELPEAGPKLDLSLALD
jgi:hypothetical protein